VRRFIGTALLSHSIHLKGIEMFTPMRYEIPRARRCGKALAIISLISWAMIFACACMVAPGGLTGISLTGDQLSLVKV
jgi:hypothetical protein